MESALTTFQIYTLYYKCKMCFLYTYLKILNCFLRILNEYVKIRQFFRHNFGLEVHWIKTILTRKTFD